MSIQLQTSYNPTAALGLLTDAAGKTIAWNNPQEEEPCTHWSQPLHFLLLLSSRGFYATCPPPTAVSQTHTHTHTSGAAPEAAQGSEEQQVLFPGGWGVREEGGREESCAGSMECTSQPHLECSQLHSPRTEPPAQRTHTHTQMLGRPSAPNSRFPFSQAPKGRAGGGREGAGRLCVPLAPRKKAPCEQSRVPRQQRTRTMSSQPGHCVQPPPALPSSPRPPTPKIAAGPRQARTPTPSVNYGANSSRKTRRRRLYHKCFYYRRNVSTPPNHHGFLNSKGAGYKKKKKEKRKNKRKPQNVCLVIPEQQQKMLYIAHYSKIWHVPSTTQNYFFWHSVHFDLVKPHILEQAHYLNCHFRSVQRKHFYWILAPWTTDWGSSIQLHWCTSKITPLISIIGQCKPGVNSHQTAACWLHKNLLSSSSPRTLLLRGKTQHKNSANQNNCEQPVKINLRAETPQQWIILFCFLPSNFLSRQFQQWSRQCCLPPTTFLILGIFFSRFGKRNGNKTKQTRKKKKRRENPTPFYATENVMIKSICIKPSFQDSIPTHTKASVPFKRRSRSPVCVCVCAFKSYISHTSPLFGWLTS